MSLVQFVSYRCMGWVNCATSSVCLFISFPLYLFHYQHQIRKRVLLKVVEKSTSLSARNEILYASCNGLLHPFTGGRNMCFNAMGLEYFLG